MLCGEFSPFSYRYKKQYTAREPQVRSPVLFRLSFYVIPYNHSILNFKAVYINHLNVRDKKCQYLRVFQRFSFVSCVRQINTSNHSPILIKVGTHDGTSPCNKSQGLVASCELAIFVTKPSRSPATSPMNSNWFKFRGTSPAQGLKLIPTTRFWSKNGQFTRCDRSLRPVAGTSPIVCTDLKNYRRTWSRKHIFEEYEFYFSVLLLGSHKWIKYSL